jgi:broad specificity phosphatase PhoE
MTKVILVRHGETIWNSEGRLQGQSNIPLSDTGLEQAVRVADRLAKETVSAVYASDLGRAAETAKAIAERHLLPVVQTPALREMGFGIWEGRILTELKRDSPEHMRVFNDKPGEFSVANAETFHQVKERAYGALMEAVQKHTGGTIVLVSHGGTLRTILCAVLELDLNRLWSFEQHNTAISVLDFHKGKTYISLVNDTHHLSELN